MPTETITYKDASVVVNAGLFGGVKIDVHCRNLSLNKMSTDEFAQLIYPAIDAAAKADAAIENPPKDPDTTPGPIAPTSSS